MSKTASVQRPLSSKPSSAALTSGVCARNQLDGLCSRLRERSTPRSSSPPRWLGIRLMTEYDHTIVPVSVGSPQL
jgi:hypothetical protein